jgi:hypothetical protein
MKQDGTDGFNSLSEFVESEAFILV